MQLKKVKLMQGISLISGPLNSVDQTLILSELSSQNTDVLLTNALRFVCVSFEKLMVKEKPSVITRHKVGAVAQSPEKLSHSSVFISNDMFGLRCIALRRAGLWHGSEI